MKIIRFAKEKPHIMSAFSYETISEGDIKIRRCVVKPESEYMEVAKDFLQKLMKEFARLSMNCYLPKYHACSMPHYYSERRLDSIVLPAISKICKGVVLTEYHVERRDKTTGELIGNGHGRADYWCIFRGYSFIIEMKGSLDRYDCDAVRQNSIVNRWGKMIQQLESSKLDCKESTERTKGTIRLGLHFVSSYAPAEPTKESIESYRSNIDDYMDAFHTRIHNEYHSAVSEPTYAATWLIPDRIIKAKDGYAGRTYPGVMLLAKVFKAI